MQMQRNVLEVVLDFCPADEADKVFGVDLAASVGRFVLLQCEAVDFDNVLADVSLLARQLAAKLTLEPALVPPGWGPAIVKQSVATS